VKGNTDNSGLQTRSLSEAEREALFKRLHLAHMRRIYQEVAVQAEKEGWSYADFLTLLLAEEVAGRKQTRLQRLTRSAHFPFLKTMDEFDFSLQSTLRLALLGSYLGPELVSEGRSLILHGKTGRGKTHLAVAIGYRAIQNGFETLFTTAAELIEDLSNAGKKGRLQESLATYTHPHVLVVDEVGYLTYAEDAANVLFHVVNNRHLRKRPIIFTTNKPLNEWGKVLHDEDLAGAILDRVLERGRFIRLDGPSGRTRHLKLEEPLPGAIERFRISGKNGSEFPEPTPDCSQGVAFVAPPARVAGVPIIVRYRIWTVRYQQTVRWWAAYSKNLKTTDSLLRFPVPEPTAGGAVKRLSGDRT
jgi:DNA replication protein DnaC